MEGETCKSCGHMSYLPPSAQHIRCVACRTLISVRNTNDMINFEGTTEWGLDLTKKKTEAKLLCHRLRKRHPFSNEKQEMPPPAISNTDQPPKGSRNTNNMVHHRVISPCQSCNNVRNIRELLFQQYDFLILASNSCYIFVPLMNPSSYITARRFKINHWRLENILTSPSERRFSEPQNLIDLSLLCPLSQAASALASRVLPA